MGVSDNLLSWKILALSSFFPSPSLLPTSPIRRTASRLQWKLLPVRRRRHVPVADIETIAPAMGTNGQDFSTQRRKPCVGPRPTLSLAGIPSGGVRMPLVMSFVSASATARAASASSMITLFRTPKVISFASLCSSSRVMVSDSYSGNFAASVAFLSWMSVNLWFKL